MSNFTWKSQNDFRNNFCSQKFLIFYDTRCKNGHKYLLYFYYSAVLNTAADNVLNIKLENVEKHEKKRETKVMRSNINENFQTWNNLPVTVAI